MKGDFSRRTFDPTKQYSQVLMQQGRVQLDADWNEQADIFLHYLRSLAADLIGPFGGPEGELGFQIERVPTDLTKSMSDLKIGHGRYYVDGLLCENLKPDAGYFHQPYLTVEPVNDDTAFPPFPLLVYLDVWERHITYVDDDSLREVALRGPDTATRAKVVWQVRVMEIDLEDMPPDTRLDFIGWIEGRLVATYPAKEERGGLKAKAKPSADPTDHCQASPEARFRGAENQLYRVEIQWQEHDGSKTKALGFKWSRDNGSVVFPVRDLEGRTVVLETLGRDEASGLKPGDWVEFVNDDTELGDPMPLFKVEEVDGARRSVRLAPVEGAQYPVLSAEPGSHPLLRRWDHHASPSAHGGVDRLGAVSYEFKDEPTWLDLEDGIQIQFQPGSYRPGDYWLVPARTDTGDVEWPGLPTDPTSLPPHGVEHHYAPLAFVDSAGELKSLLRFFSPLAPRPAL